MSPHKREPHSLQRPTRAESRRWYYQHKPPRPCLCHYASETSYEEDKRHKKWNRLVKATTIRIRICQQGRKILAMSKSASNMGNSLAMGQQKRNGRRDEKPSMKTRRGAPWCELLNLSVSHQRTSHQSTSTHHRLDPALPHSDSQISL